MMNHRFSLPLLLVYLLTNSLPVTAEELDMTMQVLKPGEEPEAIIQRIRLPKPEPASTSTEPPAKESADANIDNLTEEVDTLQETTTETVTDTVKDINDGTIKLPKTVKGSATTAREVTDNTDTAFKEAAKAAREPVQESLPDAKQAVDELHQQESDALSRDAAIERLDDMSSGDAPMDEPVPETPDQIMDELPAEEDISKDNLQETIETLP